MPIDEALASQGSLQPIAEPAVAQSTSNRDWTLICVTFNSVSDLRKHWAETERHGAEWIVVDNGSTDDSVAVARGLGASHVIELGRNVGFGGANNIGVSIAAGRYIAFVNPDIAVDFTSLSLMRDAIDLLGGLVAPQLLSHDGSLQPNGRGFPTLQNKIGNRLGRREAEYFVTSVDWKNYAVCWVIGAALAGRRETFDKLGSWDASFFIYYEDSDICIRAWEAGFPVHLIGSVRWVHGWARETKKLRVRPWLREVASAARFYRRYPRMVWTESKARASMPYVSEVMGRPVS